MLAVLLVSNMPATSAACDLLDDRLEPVRVLSATAERVTVSGEFGALRLASFRVAPDQKDAADRVLSQLAAPPPGAVVEAAPLGDPDRWGRKPAILVLRRNDGSVVRFPDDLIAAGAGLAWPEPLADPCLEVLGSLEDEARQAGRGLWTPGLTTINASSPDVSPDDEGRPAEVSGMVEAVVFRRSRIYVNFGAAFRGRISVQVLLPKGRAQRDALRARINDLAGRQVLIRGIMEGGGGTPRLMVSDARQIKVLNGTRK